MVILLLSVLDIGRCELQVRHSGVVLGEVKGANEVARAVEVCRTRVVSGGDGTAIRR